MVSHVQYFFFIPPPEFRPADEQVKPLYSPLYASFSCLTYLFCFIPEVALQQTEKLKHAAEKSMENVFVLGFLAGTDESLGRIGNQMSGCKLLK